MDAAQRGDAAAVEALLRAGADPDFYNGQHSAIYAAAKRGHASVMDVLLAHGADIDAVDVDANGFTALCTAACEGDLDTMRLLLDRGADVHAARTDAGYTALHDAAQQGQIDAMRLLLDRGASVAATTSEDDGDVYGFVSAQPLHIAAFLKHAAAVELLLARGADVRATAAWGDDVTGLTPLHCAVRWVEEYFGPSHTSDEALATVRALLDAGAPADAADSRGQQPLHVADFYGVPDTAAMLVARGADVNAADGRGAAPLHYACLHLLREAPLRTPTSVRPLLDAGADVNAPWPAERGRTPLHLAARYADDDDGVAVVAELLQHGADARAVDYDGRTPLHWACDPVRCVVPEVVELLLAHGADARAADASGRQPLHCLAARRPQQLNGGNKEVDEYLEAEDNAKVVLLLKCAGADAFAADAQHCTPLMLAAASGNTAASSALARRGPPVPQCGRCVAADEVRAGAQVAVVGMAAEAVRLQRQQAALERERSAWERERAAWQRERAALARERAAWRKERAAVEAARGSGGSGSAEQQQEEGQPAAKRKRGSAGAARRRR